MLEFIHLFVEVLDQYFGSVCELDLVFNFYKVYQILDEMVVGGEVMETSKIIINRAMKSADYYEWVTTRYDCQNWWQILITLHYTTNNDEDDIQVFEENQACRMTLLNESLLEEAKREREKDREILESIQSSWPMMNAS